MKVVSRLFCLSLLSLLPYMAQAADACQGGTSSSADDEISCLKEDPENQCANTDDLSSKGLAWCANYQAGEAGKVVDILYKNLQDVITETKAKQALKQDYHFFLRKTEQECKLQNYGFFDWNGDYKDETGAADAAVGNCKVDADTRQIALYFKLICTDQLNTDDASLDECEPLSKLRERYPQLEHYLQEDDNQ